MTIEGFRRRAGLTAAAVLLVSACGVAPTTTDSAEPNEAIAPYPGWTELARLGPADVSNAGEAVARGDRSADIHHLLISAVCTGTGSLAISVPGLEDRNESAVDCPIAAAPQRSMPNLIDRDSSWEVRVVLDRPLDFEVLIEGSDVPLHIPPIIVTAGGRTVEMHGGCWAISLSWGYDAADQCGTTIPSEPIESIEMDRDAPASITIDGWEITRAAALCGVLDRGAGQPDLFEAMPDCTVEASLDGRAVELTGLKPSSEPWLVELNLAARSGWDDEFSGPFYAYVSVP